MGLFGVDIMVYCAKCGLKNEDTSEYCTKCGASLKISRHESRRTRHVEDECFGLPRGGSIVGLIIGIIIILWGLTQIPGMLPEGFNLWWLIIIAFGILMIAGSLYKFSRD